MRTLRSSRKKLNYFSLKFKATEFMQYRNPVGFGPSSKTWPRCAPHRAQCTSVRVSPISLSVEVSIFSFAIGCQKLGQPVPDSNFVSEVKRSLPQQMHE